MNKNLETLLNKSVILKEDINKYLESQNRKNLTIGELNILWDKFKDDYTSATKLIDSLWWDWFCEDFELFDKGRDVMNNVISEINNEKLLDNTYIFLKNNLGKRNYDSFSICDINSGDVLYWIGIKDPSSDKLYSIYKDDWNMPALETNDIEKVVEFFNNMEN